MPIYGSKFQNLRGPEKFELFDIWIILKNWHLMTPQIANWWHIQKSWTGHLEYPSIHLSTDSWWNKSMQGAL